MDEDYTQREDGYSYRLNPSIRCSPPVNDRLTIYFGDRNTTAELSTFEWDVFNSQILSHTSVKDIFSLCLPSIDKNKFPNENIYFSWLITSGILVEDSVSIETKSSKPNKLNQSNLHTGNNSIADHKRTLLVDFRPLLDRLNIKISPSLVTFQIFMWPFSVGLFVLTIYLFYFSPASIGSVISQGSNPLAAIGRLFVLFLVVSFISTVLPILSSIALGISDSKLFFQFNLGFIPSFTKDTNFREYRLKLSEGERFFLLAQSLMAKLYLATISILTLLLYLRIPTISQAWIVSVLLSTIQISLFSIFFDALPIGNTTGTKLLVIRRIIPRGLLPTALKHAKQNLVYIRQGQLRHISHKWSLIYVGLFIASLMFKLGILMMFIIPSLSLELPLVFGYWTPIVVRTSLLLIILRFFFIRISSRLLERQSQSSLIAKSSPLPSEGSEQRLSKNQFNQLPHFNFVHWIQSKRLFLVLLILIFFLPFPATISASASVVESKGLDIRASEEAIISNIYVQGPSEAKVLKGTILMNLSSPELLANYDTASQEILNLEAQIRSAKIAIQSLESGSAVELAKSRDDELLIAKEDVDRYKAEIASLNSQLKLTESTISSYTSLLESGAASDLQLRSYLITKEQLLGQLATAQTNYNSAVAKIRKAKRNKFVDQDLKLKENLSNAYETLESSIRKKTQSDITLRSIQDRLNKFEITMPFDGVVSSATAGLLNRRVAPGETLITIKSLPLTNLIALVPDYDRNKLRLGMMCNVRLYSDSYSEYKGSVESISPSTVSDNGLSYIEVNVKITEDLPTNYIGTSGFVKINYGSTFLLKNLFDPVLRFINLDVWSFMP